MNVLKVISGAVSKLFNPVGNNLGRWGGGGGWWPVINEPYTGAWQKNDELYVCDILSHPVVYACITLISNDIGKLRTRLVRTVNGITSEVTEQSPYWTVLKKPNRYQNQIQFKEWWMMSKLRFGNAYALKVRDGSGITRSLYLLDPCKVKPLVTEEGDIYYQLSEDNLSNISPVDAYAVVPASEIIHDRMNCLYHPLVGIPPLYAAGLVAQISLKILSNASSFFGNKSTPSGVLTAPGVISPATAGILKETWTDGYTGANAGKVAVLAEGMKFEAMSQSAADSQLIETMDKMSELICTAFHVPGYKVGVGPMPAYNNIEALNQEYYQQALQVMIEEFELCMTEGLGTPDPMSVELELKGLLRMDSKTQMEFVAAGINGEVFTTNEGRKEFNLPPLPGGDTIYKQQQDFPLSEIAKNKLPDPAAVVPVAEPEPEEPEEEPTPEAEEEVRALLDYIQKGLTDA